MGAGHQKEGRVGAGAHSEERVIEGAQSEGRVFISCQHLHCKKKEKEYTVYCAQRKKIAYYW